MKVLKLKINNVEGYKPGEIIKVKCLDRVPLEVFWRDRLQESNIDNCVSVIKDVRKKEVKQ